MPRHVILGVGAGISAYKACELLRRLTESGCEVRVIPTRDALRFVGEATWAALSGKPATADAWADVHEVPHVRLGQWADLVFVAPATADLLARAAAGRADDLLTAALLVARCPVVFAPAMHTEMWEHPATQANVSLLRDRGALVLDPASGRLTGPDTGTGRLPEPAELFAVALRVLDRGADAMLPDLIDRRVVVSAGGTREELDPVRFLGNWSSGLQGYALARTAAARGADVTLVSANVALDDPAGAKVIRVVSALQLREAMVSAAAGAPMQSSWRLRWQISVRPFGINQRLRKPEPDRSRSGSPKTRTCCASSRRTAATRARSSSASPRRPGTCSATAAPSWPARAVTCSSSTRWAAGSRSAPATTRPSCWLPTAA